MKGQTGIFGAMPMVREANRSSRKSRMLGRGALVVVVTALGLLTAGCANNGGGSTNPFVGTWTGTATVGGQTAAATLTATDGAWTFTAPSVGINQTGTYTYEGSSALLYMSGAPVGAAVITGNALQITATEGVTATLTKTVPATPADPSANPFVGTWTGPVTIEGSSQSFPSTLTVTAGVWTFTVPTASPAINETGTYTYVGSTATLKQGTDTVGTATISGTTMTVNATNGVTMTLTKS
jgi:hypothetical protein